MKQAPWLNKDGIWHPDSQILNEDPVNKMTQAPKYVANKKPTTLVNLAGNWSNITMQLMEQSFR